MRLGANSRKVKGEQMKLLLMIAPLLLTGCGDGESDRQALADCYYNGVQYYKDIGSYPRLSDGRNAEEVALQKCGRSKFAFGPVGG